MPRSGCCIFWAGNSLPPGTNGQVTHDQKTHLVTKAKATDPNTTARLTTSLKELKLEGCQHTTWRLQSIAAIHTLTSLQTA
jgi:hypothetical protein